MSPVQHGAGIRTPLVHDAGPGVDPASAISMAGDARRTRSEAAE
jgi:hypothetical protein